MFVTGISNASFHFQSVNRTEPDMNITDLQPGQKYNISIIAFSHGEPSNFSTAIEFNTGKSLKNFNSHHMTSQPLGVK